MKKLFKNKAGILAAIIVVFSVWTLIRMAATEIYRSRQAYSGIEIENSDAVAEKIRTGLKHRAYKLHIRFHAHTDDEEAIKALVDDLLEKALYESEDPSGGDYIRCQLGGYQMNYDVERALLGFDYKMEFMPTYYSTADEEAYVDGRVAEILKSLDAWDLPQEERVRKVHDYVTGLLSYDSVHKTNEESHGKTTAYHALRYHQVVCQGYAVLSYRLLKELGIECRIVTGDALFEGFSERHAWLTVTVNGEKLYMDPTLDDVNSCYDWYLKSAEEFEKDHVPDDKGIQ